MKRLLLHTCCAPCLIMPLEYFAEEGYEVTAAYVNPNIQPEEEYERRLLVLRQFAEDRQVGLFEAPYDPGQWESSAGSIGGPFPLDKGSPEFAYDLKRRRERCRLCYRLRFEQVASLAFEMGFDAVSTTLAISPYQFSEVLFEELEAAASGKGLEAVCIDFRGSYTEATRRSQRLGMYRQNYCGCRFSFEEANIERQARREARGRGQGHEGVARVQGQGHEGVARARGQDE